MEFFDPRKERNDKNTQSAKTMNKKHLWHSSIVANAFSIAGDPSVAPSASVGIVYGRSSPANTVAPPGINVINKKPSTINHEPATMKHEPTVVPGISAGDVSTMTAQVLSLQATQWD